MLAKKLFLAVLSVGLIFTAGCGQKEYYSAMKEQNTAINTTNLIREKEKAAAQDRHEERMLILIRSSVTAAALTPEKTDDVLVPLLIMSIEDKRIMAAALTANSQQPLQFQTIKAPDSFGDGLKKSTAAILGVGAIVAGIVQSNNLADVATAGLVSAGTQNIVNGEGNSIINDSYKSGSQNTITGDGNELYGGPITATNSVSSEQTDQNGEAGVPVSTSFDLQQCLSNPPAGYSSSGTPLYYYGCSCGSYANGEC